MSELYEKATRRPWAHEQMFDASGTILIRDAIFAAGDGCIANDIQVSEDAALIVHAVNNIERIEAENTSLQSEVKVLREALTSASQFIGDVCSDIHERVYRAEEMQDHEAFKDADRFYYDGDLASLQVLIADALSHTGADQMSAPAEIKALRLAVLALRQCRERFDEYAKSHAKKADEEATFSEVRDRKEKAIRNEAMVPMINGVLESIEPHATLSSTGEG